MFSLGHKNARYGEAEYQADPFDMTLVLYGTYFTH